MKLELTIYKAIQEIVDNQIKLIRLMQLPSVDRTEEIEKLKKNIESLKKKLKVMETLL